MKMLSLSIFSILLFFHVNCFAQNKAILDQGTVNIATLIIDFDTYEFEGGNLTHYVCEACYNDSIPLNINFDEPGDFGGMTFKLAPTNDTVFDASIIWMGLGEIHQPYEFSNNSPFSEANILTPQPENIRLLYFDGKPLDQTYLLEKIDSVWDVVDSLEITKDFAENGFETLIYFYPPAIGMINPSVAKWVVFLYQKGQNNGIIDQDSKENFTIYPNPNKGLFNISSYSEKYNHSYQIYDITGVRILSGKINAQNQTLDISESPNGLYFIQLFDQNEMLIKTKKIVKQ